MTQAWDEEAGDDGANRGQRDQPDDDLENRELVFKKRNAFGAAQVPGAGAEKHDAQGDAARPFEHRDERHPDQRGNGQQNVFATPIQDDQQGDCGHRIAEQDVAAPQEDVVQAAEHGQRGDAADVGEQERTLGGLGAGEHDGKAHAEQQRKHGPEFAGHKVHDEVAKQEARAGLALGDAGAKIGSRAVEVLDIHHQDADEGKAANHVERLDALRFWQWRHGAGCWFIEVRSYGTVHVVVHVIRLPG